MDLQRCNATVWWQGKGGMRIHDIVKTVKKLLSYEDPPQFLVLHCGGNDLGIESCYKVRTALVGALRELHQTLPGTRLIWSQMLPRLGWRNERHHAALERTRLRVNNRVASEAIQLGGGYVRYPDLVEDPGLFIDDVHLSHIGNELFLYRLQQGLQAFISSRNCTVSPPVGESGPWLALQ